MKSSDLPSAESQQLHGVLKSVFGFDSFRPYQESVVQAYLSNRDVFTVLPTGGGKSLCFQLPAVIRDGLTVVISPLIALMKDQVDASAAAGIKAACLNSSMEYEEWMQVRQQLNAGEVSLLYVAPEWLAKDSAYDSLADWGISALAVDEAHCVSEWGHDFRPEYRRISEIRNKFPHIPLMALTATATEQVQADILKQLKLNDPFIVRAGFDRPELFYRVESKSEALKRITGFIKKRPETSGIVYRATRNDVEKTTEYLIGQGIQALPYHAGMPPAIRRKNQNKFKKDEVFVIVATIAFGMGIDKPDIRFVIHGDLPKNLESYYQETGRAGRDGDEAEVLLLWNAGDLVKIRFHQKKLENPQEQEKAAQSLKKMLQFAQSYSCRRKVLLQYFGEPYLNDCGHCDVCRGEVESVDSTVAAQKLLSAIARTGQTFGAHYLVDILRGTLNKKIRDRGHQNLPTFGVGADQPRKYWLSIANDLESAGYVFRDEERYSAMAITPEGVELLYGRREFRTIKRTEDKHESLHTRTLKIDIRSGKTELSEKDIIVFEKLRDLRLSLAREIGKPPFVIFSDQTLRELAAIRPRTDEEMLKCYGVGQKKLETWGSLFLDVIREGSTDILLT